MICRVVRRQDAAHEQDRQIALVAFLVAFHLAGDLVWPQGWRIRCDWLVVAGFGFAISQVNLIATWAALAPGKRMVRLPWAMFLGVLMWYALVLGQRLARPDYLRDFSRGDAVVLGISILFGILVLQLPLWIANLRFGWRLVAGEDMPGEVNERQFRLSHLLAGMFLLSVALSLGRVVLPARDIGEMPRLRELGFLLPIVAGCNLLVTSPCIWGAFARWRLIPLLAGTWVVYAALVTLVECGVLGVLLNGIDPDALPQVFLMNLIQCVTVWGTLLLLRATGFRLVRTHPN
jgi:hypothetical protein